MREDEETHGTEKSRKDDDPHKAGEEILHQRALVLQRGSHPHKVHSGDLEVKQFARNLRYRRDSRLLAWWNEKKRTLKKRMMMREGML